jgi:hypothetical protein
MFETKSLPEAVIHKEQEPKGQVYDLFSDAGWHKFEELVKKANGSVVEVIHPFFSANEYYDRGERYLDNPLGDDKFNNYLNKMKTMLVSLDKVARQGGKRLPLIFLVDVDDSFNSNDYQDIAKEAQRKLESDSRKYLNLEITKLDLDIFVQPTIEADPRLHESGEKRLAALAIQERVRATDVNKGGRIDIARARLMRRIGVKKIWLAGSLFGGVDKVDAPTEDSHGNRVVQYLRNNQRAIGDVAYDHVDGRKWWISHLFKGDDFEKDAVNRVFEKINPDYCVGGEIKSFARGGGIKIRLMTVTYPDQIPSENQVNNKGVAWERGVEERGKV